VIPNVDISTLTHLIEVCKKYPLHLHPAAGLHPCSVKKDFNGELNVIRNYLQENKCVAIGEIGIDLFWDRTYLKEQQEALETQLQWAKELDLPIILHCRDSFNEVYSIVRKMMPLKGIFHAFSGSTDDAKKAIDLGFFLGIGGVVTFKNGGLDKIISQLDLENLVLETDSPYLTPVPHRGKRNEPINLTLIASKIAVLLNTSIEDVARITTQNARSIFKLD
jgi:TatD DNase family protein